MNTTALDGLMQDLETTPSIETVDAETIEMLLMQFADAVSWQAAAKSNGYAAVDAAAKQMDADDVERTKQAIIAAWNRRSLSLNEREAVAVDPAKAALRAFAEASKSVRCPICNGIEGCDHTVRERLLAALNAAPPIHGDGKVKAPRPIITEDEFMLWLGRAYNHPGNDGRNFTRWNMRIEFNAGIDWVWPKIPAEPQIGDAVCAWPNCTCAPASRCDPPSLVEGISPEVLGFLYAVMGADTWLEAGTIWDQNPDQRKAAHAAFAALNGAVK